MYKMYKVYTSFLEHASGSKFYEAVVIADADANRHNDGLAVLIKRWGAVDKNGKHANGQVAIASGVPSQMLAEFTRIVREKGSPSRGYFATSRAAFGMHRLHGQDIITHMELMNALEAHYETAKVHSIVEQAGGRDADTPRPQVALELSDVPHRVVQAAKDERWGSW